MEDFTTALQHTILGVLACLGLLILAVSILLAEARYRRKKSYEDYKKHRDEVREEMKKRFK